MTAQLRWGTVLFDLDGTLVDTIDLIVASFDHALATVADTSRPQAEIRSWIGRRLGEVFEAEYPQHAVELEDTYVAWNRSQEAMIRRYDGIEELVRALLEAQARIGVVTSKRRETAAAALDLVGLTELVPILAASEDTTAHKPDPAPLLHGAARTSTPAERCVYVGDASVDVVAARAAGMTSIAVLWGAGAEADLRAADPDHVVATPAELGELLFSR